MLNPVLWEKIRDAGVRLTLLEEDVPAVFTIPTSQSSLLRKKGERRYADVNPHRWGEKGKMNCPCCGDTKERLFICHLNGTKTIADGKTLYFGSRLFKCWNEGCDIRPWLESIGVTSLHIDMSDLHERSPVKWKNTKEVKQEIQWPVPSWTLSDDSHVPEYVSKYLLGRGYQPAELSSLFGVRFVPVGATWTPPSPNEKQVVFYESRLLIPIYQGRRLVSWQARKFSDSSDKKRKYIFPSGATKGEWLYNLDEALLSPTVVVFEGCPSVWRFGSMDLPPIRGAHSRETVGAVCTFGKNVTDAQIELMKTVWSFDGRCLIFLDPDTYADNLDVHLKERILSASAFKRGVEILRSPDTRQPGDLPQELLHKMVLDSCLDPAHMEKEEEGGNEIENTESESVETMKEQGEEEWLADYE